MDINIEVKELAKVETAADLTKYLSKDDQEKLKYFFLGAALGKSASTEKTDEDNPPAA